MVKVQKRPSMCMEDLLEKMLCRILEIVDGNLEIALRMVAGRANLGSGLAHNDMTAVAAFPNLH